MTITSTAIAPRPTIQPGSILYVGSRFARRGVSRVASWPQGTSRVLLDSGVLCRATSIRTIAIDDQTGNPPVCSYCSTQFDVHSRCRVCDLQVGAVYAAHIAAATVVGLGNLAVLHGRQVGQEFFPLTP